MFAIELYLEMNMIKSIILRATCLAFFLNPLVQVFAQTMTITGEVRDRNTYAKIRGVNIFIKDTHIGTTSDFKGYFNLQVPLGNERVVVVFRHIAYEIKTIPLDSLRNLKSVYLQPRIIQMPAVEIEEEAIKELEIRKDLPQTVSVIESRSFEIKGFVDAGDLLRVDHSVQLDEEISGQKTVAIRGGNSDEVVVLYNGVKLNNAYDNVFDLSLIDLEGVDRLEIIKGSNTVLYGPEAFSGVINIVPKQQQEYTLRFQQRIGTYSSGNWGIHFYKKFGPVNVSYSHRRGGFRRDFKDLPEAQSRLENSSLHHTASLNYSLSENPDGSPRSSLGVMWLYTSLDYDNRRDVESISNFNHLFALNYTGNIWKIKNVDISISRKQLEEDQFLATGTSALTRGIDDQSFLLNAQKRFILSKVDLLFAYQFQRAQLDFLDDRRNFDDVSVGLQSSDFKRTHHGLVGLAKLHGDTGGDLIRNIDVDFSLRHDRINDTQANAIIRGAPVSGGLFDESDWRKTMFKFSVNMLGYKNDVFFNSFFNFGTNFKFPTLFQQVNAPASQVLEVERNRSFEVGLDISRELKNHQTVYGFQLSGNYFLNIYDNKLVEVTNLLGGRGLFTVTPFARISGFESKSRLFLFRKKATIEVGWSRYFISDKNAFPFKSDFKRTLNLTIDHLGYSFGLLWFKEGEQAGVLLTNSNEQVQTILPDYANLDVHFNKNLEIGKLKLFANFSVRNLLDDSDEELLGLTIRDRRFYLTFGANY